MDPRADEMGIRVYDLRPPEQRSQEPLSQVPGCRNVEWIQELPGVYRTHRILQAIPEGVDEMEPVLTRLLLLLLSPLIVCGSECGFAVGVQPGRNQWHFLFKGLLPWSGADFSYPPHRCDTVRNSSLFRVEM